MVSVGDLDRREAHFVGSHEGGQLLVIHGVGEEGEVLVLIVWSDVRVFFSVYSTLPSPSNDILVNSSSLWWSKVSGWRDWWWLNIGGVLWFPIPRRPLCTGAEEREYPAPTEEEAGEEGGGSLLPVLKEVLWLNEVGVS